MKKEFTPIAMRCNKEQFEAIKPKLEKIGRICELIGSFQKYEYLTNNFNQNIHKNLEFDFIESNICWREEHQNNIHETWNERIFLEACGIETEETFEITKETIIKYKMKDEFPEVFEVKLEVGKWYKDKFNRLFYVLSIIDSKNCLGYGFGCITNNFIPQNKCLWEVNGSETEATEQEVFEALKNEAVKRYKKGDYINGLYSRKVKTLTFESTGIGQDKVHIDWYYCVWMNIGNGLNEKVFDNGTWATIIKTKTKEEAEKLLNCKIV